jgi:Glycosyltransferase
MRILIISNLYPPDVRGGFELACRNVAAGLSDRKHDVRVLTTFAPIASGDDPAWVHRRLTSDTFSPPRPLLSPLTDARRAYDAGCSQYGNTAALLKEIQVFAPDIVYLWHIWGIGGLGLLDLLAQLQIPWLLHLMDAVPTYLLAGVGALPVSLFAGAERALVARAPVISMSEHLLAEIVETTGIHFDHRPEVIPGWVDTRELRQRRRYGVGGQLCFVAVGAFSPQKGTDLIVEAVARLVGEGRTNFTVDIYSLAEPEQWITLADRLGVLQWVRFRRALPQKLFLEALPNYDALLFPTAAREPFGFLPIEAAACGVVPIMTRNAGAAERLADGVHAMKIDRTVDDLAAAIRSLLNGEVDMPALGRRAARYIRRELSFERCLDAIERFLYRQVRPWDSRRAADPRLVATLFAKHELGHYLTLNP